MRRGSGSLSFVLVACLFLAFPGCSREERSPPTAGSSPPAAAKSPELAEIPEHSIAALLERVVVLTDEGVPIEGAIWWNLSRGKVALPTNQEGRIDREIILRNVRTIDHPGAAAWSIRHPDFEPRTLDLRHGAPGEWRSNSEVRLVPLSVFRIALCGPMTGSAQAFGESLRNAVRMAQKEVNEKGGILWNGAPRPVELVVWDDRGDPTSAHDVARKIALDDPTLLVLGHFNSTCSLAAKEIYLRHGIPSISPGSTHPDVCRGSPYAFRTIYHDRFQATQIATYMVNVLRVESAAVLFDMDDYGSLLQREFRRTAQVFGGLKVVAALPYGRESTENFAPLVEQAREAGAEAVFIAGLYNEGARICKAMEKAGWRVPVIGCDGLLSPTFIGIGEDAVEGVMATSPFLYGAPGAAAEEQTFRENYRAAYGRDPSVWAALIYDTFLLAAEVCRRAGPDREKIRAELAKMTGPDNCYTGITGRIWFDENGDCFSRPVHVAVVRDGEFVPAEKQLPR